MVIQYWSTLIGAFVLTTRGGDFALYIGEDVSIGYLSHNDKTVRLYLEETLTFLLLTTEASVALNAAGGKLKNLRMAYRNIGEFGPAVNKSHREHLPLRQLFFIYLT